MPGVELLAERLTEAGFATAVLEPVTGGCICAAGIAVLSDGGRVFAKTLPDADGDEFEADADLFRAEAAGLAALRDLGGVRVPAVIHASSRLLVLEELRPRGEGERFWEQLARMTAALHTSTVSDMFGWHRDGWHGRLRQDNRWEADGHAFFAEHRVLRWLPEPLVEAEFDHAERRAIERLSAALPELIPPHPASLTHGDLWPGNIASDGAGQPALIDPAVSYTWPEVDLAALWCPPDRPPASERFFAVYEELARPFDGWRDQAQLLRIWDLFSVVAHGLDTWGAAELVRKVIAPFRYRTATRRRPGCGADSRVSQAARDRKPRLTALTGMDFSTCMSDEPAALRRWHAVVASKDPALLDDLLADDVVFRSPAVFAPQEGKALTAGYLRAALQVLGPSLRYVGQWHDQAGAVLEFEADLDGSYVQGVDILRWNAEGKLVSFTVMVRPLRGLQKLVELMALQLGAGPA